MEAKGAKFLLVTGILMIMGGVLSFIIAVSTYSSLDLLISLSTYAEEAGYNVDLITFAYILAIIGAVLELVAGIIGVAFSKKTEKAKVCFIAGIVVAIICVVNNILIDVAGGDFNIASLLLGLVLPILYIIGANKNKAKA